MRIRHSLKAFVPFILMLATGRTVQAQYGPPGPTQGMPPAGTPEGFLSYPTESPYQSLFQQNYNSNGMWFQDSNNGFGPYSHPRKYFMNVDYTRTKTRNMRGVFGSSSAQTYHQQNDPESDGIITNLESYNYFNAATADMIPTLGTSGMRISGGFWNADGSGLLIDGSWGAFGSSEFNARDNALSGRLSTETILGLQATGGRYQPHTFNLNGLTDYGVTTNQILGSGVPFDEANATQYGALGTTSQVLNRSLLNLFGIPIGDGRTVADSDAEGGNGLGVTIPYDIQFLMVHSVTTMGTSMDGAFSPVYERGSLKVNPVVGGRYQWVKEEFAFRGIDSGLSYGVANGDNDTPSNAKVFPPGDGVDGNNNFITDDPLEAGTLVFNQINPSDPIMVRASQDVTVTSNLAGPEFGFHYTVGDSKGVTLIGSSKLAAMFNNEKIRLRGDNLFNHMNPDNTVIPTQLDDGFDTNNLNGPSQNAYSDSASSVHLSPLFEQTLTAEFPIFSHVPVLRNVQLLEDAKLRLGYTFLFIGEVADPNQSIDYSAVNPRLGLSPTVRAERDTFFQNSFNVGLNWNY